MSTIELTTDKLILLRKGVKYIVLFDAEDFDLIKQYRWFIDTYGYVVGYRKDEPTNNKKWVKMHRLVMGLLSESLIEVDHRHGVKTDNRKLMLRTATRSNNQANVLHKKGKSNYRGVSYFNMITRKNNKVYRYKYPYASIKVNGKRIGLGIYKTEELAAKAYDEAAKKYRGEFAILNFV